MRFARTIVHASVAVIDRSLFVYGRPRTCAACASTSLSSSYYPCPLILVMRHSEKRSKHQCCDGNAANGPQPTCDLRVAFDGHRGRAICFTCDGQVIRAYEGETVAAALLAQGRRVLRTTSRESQPRGVFCNMGICFDCLVEIDWRPNRRACQSFVVEGMRVRTQCGVGQWELPK